MSGFYVNGAYLKAQPETHQWKPRDKVGIDGNGRAIYPALYNYELRWGLMSVGDFNQIYNVVSSIGATGTAVVALPKYGNATWAFYAYTGCHLDELTFSSYYEEHYQDVVLVVTGIKV